MNNKKHVITRNKQRHSEGAITTEESHNFLCSLFRFDFYAKKCYAVALTPTKVKSAFTLAEVLITIGVIGVVAAITIPTIMTKINHIKLKSQFKEGYAILSQAVKMANDDGWQIQSAESAKNFMNYFKGATLCKDKDKNSTHCVGRTEKDDNNSVSVTNRDYKYTNYAKNSKYVQTNAFDDFQFYLPNNMLIIIDLNIDSWKTYLITIDINGKNAKPNALGHDVFTFGLKETEKSGGYELVPMGADDTYFSSRKGYCSKTSTDPYNGFGCTYYAVKDETYFDNLP